MYTLGSATDQLFIQNPPNNGTQTVPITITLDGNPLDFSASNGFDIAAGVNVATANSQASGSGLALLTVGGITGLYSIDLATGAATRVGNFLSGTPRALRAIFVDAPDAQKSWRRLDVIQGVKFTDGVEVISPQTQAAA